MITRIIKKFIVRYDLEILYLFMGILTTIINFVVYFLSREIFRIHYIEANIIAWVIAVLFAYIANRTWVFQSKNTNILHEIWLFVISRLFTLLLETGLLFIAVDVLHSNDLAAKIVIAILIVACNYITAKWIIFKRGK